MFEAKLTEGLILKKIVDSIKDIVTDVNIDISPSGKCPHPPILKSNYLDSKNSVQKDS
jgi:Proliferating cell nuclear antigen, N-terminal domain